MKFTIQSLAKTLQIDYACAVGFVKFLEKKKIVNRVGKIKHETQGRVSKVLFEGPMKVIVDLTGRGN